MDTSVAGYISPADYHFVVKKIRAYFEDERGFLESPVQCRLSCLSACEDPKTVTTLRHKGQVWPLPQTGQMQMEVDYLASHQDGKPYIGLYCMSISYRSEPNRDPERHAELAFPLPEWEEPGDMNQLIETEKGLLRSLGYQDSDFHEIDYDDACVKYGVDILENEHEKLLCNDLGPVVFLKHFPVRTSPFFNMKLHDSEEHAYKVDVLLHGMETFGSAERSCDVPHMRKMFDTISEGKYKEKLYHEFGKDRVENELAQYFQYDFIPRCGGGIGLTRLIRSMKLHGLME